MAAAQLVSGRASSGCTVLQRSAWEHPNAISSLVPAPRQHWFAAESLQPAARHRLAAAWRRCAHTAMPTLAAPIEGLSHIQQQQIDVFVSFLLEENQKYNLTGVLLDKPTISIAHELHSGGAGRSAH
jgi:hypothetical protein